MVHKFDAKKMHKLDSPERRRILPPWETLEKLGLQPGDVMADIGCGIGYFTMPAAELVGTEGRVYALDIVPEMLTEVEKKKVQGAVANIVTVLTEENSLRLGEGTVTFAFICNVLHETENNLSFLNAVKRILTDKGRVAIVEWSSVRTDFGPPLDHRLDKEHVKEILHTTGFKNVEALDLGEHFYAVVGWRN